MMDIKSYIENVFHSLGSITFVKLDGLYVKRSHSGFHLEHQGDYFLYFL